MTTYTLYGNTAGITIGLTREYDLCGEDDDQCFVHVIGHRAYNATPFITALSIRLAYINSMREAGTLTREYVSKLSRL